MVITKQSFRYDPKTGRYYSGRPGFGYVVYKNGSYIQFKNDRDIGATFTPKQFESMLEAGARAEAGARRSRRISQQKDIESLQEPKEETGPEILKTRADIEAAKKEAEMQQRASFILRKQETAFAEKQQPSSFTPSPYTISAAQPFEGEQISSPEQFQRMQEREEAPIRSSIFQPLESGQQRIEQRARQLGGFAAYPARFGAGLLASPIVLGRAVTSPIKTAKGIGKIVTDPFEVGAAIKEELLTRPIAFAGEITGEVLIGYGISKGVKAIKQAKAVKAIQVSKVQRRTLPSGKVIAETARTEQAFKIGRQQFRATAKTITTQAPAKKVVSKVPIGKTGQFIQVTQYPKGVKKIATVTEVIIKKSTKQLQPKGISQAQFRFGAKGYIETIGKRPIGTLQFKLERVGTKGAQVIEKGKLVTVAERIKPDLFRVGSLELAKGRVPKGSLALLERTQQAVPQLNIPEQFVAKGIKVSAPKIFKLGKKGQFSLTPQLVRPEIIKPLRISTAPTSSGLLATKVAVRAFVDSSTRVGALPLLTPTASVVRLAGLPIQRNISRNILDLRRAPISGRSPIQDLQLDISTAQQPGTLQRGALSTGQLQVPRLITQQVTATAGAVPIVLPTIGPPITPTPAIVLPELPERKVKKQKQFKELKRTTKYQKSLAASEKVFRKFAGIKATKKTKVLGGIQEVRL